MQVQREITMTILVGFNGWSHDDWVGNINSRSGSFNHVEAYLR